MAPMAIECLQGLRSLNGKAGALGMEGGVRGAAGALSGCGDTDGDRAEGGGFLLGLGLGPHQTPEIDSNIRITVAHIIQRVSSRLEPLRMAQQQVDLCYCMIFTAHLIDSMRHLLALHEV